MKLGIIASEFPPATGGMQEHARNLAACLSGSHQVQVFTGAGTAPAAIAADCTVTPALRWRWTHDRAVLEATGVDAWLILNAGIAPYARLLAQPAFAYVHGNDFVKAWLPAPGLGVRIGRRLMPRPRRDPFLQDWREREIKRGLHATRLVFANSRFTSDLCARRFALAPSQVAVVWPGIGPEFFQNPARRREACLRIVTVARLAREAGRKNVDGVIEAIARLRGEIDIRYTVVGDGDDRMRLQQRALALGLDGSIRFAGRLSIDALRAVYAENDLFVMAVTPMPGDVEGFGMVYAEAAASGLPSLGTAVGGIVDAVQDGVTGLLLADSSVDSIVDGLRRFQRARDTFDPAALRRFADEVSAPRCSARLAALIEQTLDATRPA